VLRVSGKVRLSSYVSNRFCRGLRVCYTEELLRRPTDMTEDESEGETLRAGRGQWLRLGAMLSALLASGQVLLADPSTSFTYQGRLRDSARPAGGTYDMSFALFDAVTNGFQIGSTVTNLGVPVSNALFTVTLDFGTNAFDGSPRWLEISIRYQTNDFSVLSPRQPITATPYAIAAMSLVAPLQPALLPPNVPKLDAAQTFTSSNLFAGPAVFTNAANFFNGAFSGDGSSLSNITSTAVRRAIAFPAPIAGTNYLLDFASDVVQVSATNNINFLQSINRPLDGYYTECVWYIQAGATNCLLSFNPSWIALGTLATNWPCILTSNKTAVVAFSARGGSETNVVYAVARQE